MNIRITKHPSGLFSAVYIPRGIEKRRRLIVAHADKADLKGLIREAIHKEHPEPEEK